MVCANEKRENTRTALAHTALVTERMRLVQLGVAIPSNPDN
jgi:hypothetical protein